MDTPEPPRDAQEIAIILVAALQEAARQSFIQMAVADFLIAVFWNTRIFPNGS